MPQYNLLVVVSALQDMWTLLGTLCYLRKQYTHTVLEEWPLARSLYSNQAVIQTDPQWMGNGCPVEFRTV